MSRAITTHVIINGRELPVQGILTDHDVDHPVGVGTITLPTPRPPGLDLGAPVTIYAGFDGDTIHIFSGTIAEDKAAISQQGGLVRVELEGSAKRLFYAQHQNMVMTGPLSLSNIFRALCKARGVPRYFSDSTFAPDGVTVTFGGVSVVDGGNIIVKKDSSPGDVITRFARLYGYRMYDRPDGMVRQKKISGLPVGDVMRAYVEGGPSSNVIDVTQDRTLKGAANYIEVLGAQYTAADSSEVAVRSIPATVPFDARFGPSGVNRFSVNDSSILTNARADRVRNVHEIDMSTPHQRWSWTSTGDPFLLPGDVVSMTSPSVGSNTAMWLMRVSHSISRQGWTTSMEGWSGAGTAQPAGNDCVTQTLVGTQGFHIGNEYLSHYRNPNPAGPEKTIPFTVLEDYSTLTVRYDGHGCNSFVRNTESTASRFEIWQTIDGVYKRVASGEMPRQDENLEQRYPYSQDKYWQTNIVIALSGSLKAGGADLKMISGRDSSVGDNDDYEVKNVRLTTCGIGEPVIVVGA
jgi:hypothetical protein